ncbi:hypothetical protein L1987_86402 [Smallanthus sonchifolius]|uniref:Uncharacterized protein n=1 Tax=Smallanthus sonchifolius TaxID=185202 RepID=A0ACB8Y0S1_9ASTR|nr:hypothetical protein L1987_86402 [Smallanthus sonchifolius]
MIRRTSDPSLFFYTAGSSPVSGDSFTINLLHRDSIDSPFYDGSMSFSQRLGHALRRSFINAKRFKSHQKGSTYHADIIPDHGEFLLNVSYGKPSHKVLAIADTGSDLSWMQCEPCTKCYKHKGTLFNPKSSSTYQPVDCKSETCRAISIDENTCSSSQTCEFYESYADGSFSNGTVATETITLGDRVLENIVFGCSFNNDGVFQPTWAGIVGLGGGDYSLVSQLRSFVPGKFSYCMIPYPLTNELSNKSSKMTFGDINFGPNVVSTPLVQVEPKTYYFVTLEGISVGNKRQNISDHSSSSKPLEKGNMIVDSGTTLTMLPEKLYNKFETALKDAINVRTMKDPQKVLSLCYRATKVTSVPKVTMHFDGADVELSRENLFVTVSKHIMCLAFAPTSNLPVMGNLAQINFLVGFDLDNKMLSFKRTDCEKM